MKLDQNIPVPLYQQLRDDIRLSIETGALPYGAKVPTETELSDSYRVSRITVRKAIEELVEQGYLIKRQGKGTFVCMPRIQRKIDYLLSFSESCRACGMVPSSRVLSREILPANEEEAAILGIGAGEQMLHIRRLRCGDGVPIMCENNYYPYERFSFLMEENLEGSLYELLKDKHGIEASVSAESWIEALKASGELAKDLQVQSGEPLFYMYTQIYDEQRRIVHIGRQYMLAERYRFYLSDSDRDWRAAANRS